MKYFIAATLISALNTIMTVGRILPQALIGQQIVLVKDTFQDLFYFKYYHIMPVPVAERSKARVYGRSLAGIAGSNPAEGIAVCLL